MSEVKHTPGPWMVKGRVNTSTEAIRIESHHPAPEHHLYQVADVLDANGYPQNEANLMLIAAAPDLLEALQKLVFLAQREIADPQDATEVNRALAAIGKATGDQA